MEIQIILLILMTLSWAIGMIVKVLTPYDKSNFSGKLSLGMMLLGVMCGITYILIKMMIFLNAFR